MLLTVHAPELAYRLAMSRDAQQAARPLFATLVSHLKDDQKGLSAEAISSCLKCLEAVQERATSRLRNDIRSIMSVLRHLEGKTLAEALEVMASRSLMARLESPRHSNKTTPSE